MEWVPEQHPTFQRILQVALKAASARRTIMPHQMKEDKPLPLRKLDEATGQYLYLVDTSKG